MRPGRAPRLWPAVAAVGLLAFLGAAAGIGVPATHGARTTADEPQYLLTAISLATDRDLDIADELAAGRWRAFHAPPLPEQTEPLASGRRLSPHDPLLPLLLAAPVAAGGWAGAKLAMAAALAAAGVAFVVLHRWWYGGWTPYATGDHFVAGELSAVGSDPDYLGRSRRLLGLATDRGFGLAGWQPAFLLAVPALATLARRRPAGWAAVALPLAAGWLVATFLALTMHGWWFPGRQVVVVLPLAVLAVACWAGAGRRRRKEFAHHQDHGTPEGDQAGRHGDARAPFAVAVGGGVGVVAYAWLVADGL